MVKAFIVLAEGHAAGDDTASDIKVLSGPSARTPCMSHEELMPSVRALRAQGRSPKEIARTLGVRPAVIAPLVRVIAAERAAAAQEAPLAGCWVTPGWSAGLSVEGHAEWPRGTAADDGASGLLGVVVAREHRNRKVSACGYLVDSWCLGVKNAIGPKVGDQYKLRSLLDTFRLSFRSTLLEAPIDLAQQLVLGAEDYARGLGFEPHPDFEPARGHLGSWEGVGAIRFGRDGEPYFVQGPDDDPAQVMSTLERSVGRGKYHYIVSGPSLAA